MAILNSTWSKLSLELTCTVMGGGALKIEATHLKKMLIPKLSAEQLGQMEKIGSILIDEGKMSMSIQDEIDSILTSNIGDKNSIVQMRTLLAKKYQERSK